MFCVCQEHRAGRGQSRGYGHFRAVKAGHPAAEEGAVAEVTHGVRMSVQMPIPSFLLPSVHHISPAPFISICLVISFAVFVFLISLFSSIVLHHLPYIYYLLVFFSKMSKISCFPPLPLVCNSSCFCDHSHINRTVRSSLSLCPRPKSSDYCYQSNFNTFFFFNWHFPCEI